jgi:hypothetical protein
MSARATSAKRTETVRTVQGAVLAKAEAIYDQLDACVIKALGEAPSRGDGVAAWLAAITFAGYLEGWLVFHKVIGNGTRLGIDNLNTIYTEGLNHGFKDAMEQGAQDNTTSEAME